MDGLIYKAAAAKRPALLPYSSLLPSGYTGAQDARNHLLFDAQKAQFVPQTRNPAAVLMVRVIAYQPAHF